MSAGAKRHSPDGQDRPHLGPRLLGFGSTGLGVVALVLALAPSVAVGGTLLGVVGAGLVAGVLATVLGAVNGDWDGDWESVPATVTAVDGKEDVGLNRTEAVPIGSKISSAVGRLS